MISNTFRKYDAPSVLVVDKTMDEVIGKPNYLDELAQRVVDMMNGAESFGLLLKSTTLGDFKKAINQILLRPLQKPVEGAETIVQKKPDSVLVDAFWDEMSHEKDIWQKFREALTRAYNMKILIGEHSMLTNKDTLQTSKDNFNDTVVKPMLGVNEYE